MLAKLVLFVLLCLAVYALFRGGKRIFHILFITYMCQVTCTNAGNGIIF